jgi:microcin C transport system substrate-binding protein
MIRIGMENTMRALALMAALLFIAVPGVAQEAKGVKSHGLSLFNDLKYGPDFSHFDYVNPEAPKGGAVKLAALGTFDNLNPFILKGNAATGMGLMFENLLVGSTDEPSSAYGLIAESVEVPDDRSWVAFTLRKEARFHDGTPITPEDVIFSLEVLKAKGLPLHRLYFASVAQAKKTGAREVRFTFTDNTNRELPFILGTSLPILSKAYWTTHEFEKTTLSPPLGSGPYRIEDADPGRSITYRRIPDYWGRNLPVNAGRYNFETIRFDYYRDSTVALEALKAGEYDLRQENVSKNWATAYDVPPVRAGLIITEEIPHEIPTGMQCFVMNTRRSIFQDRRVREALTYAFDFEWTNKTLFHGAYARTKSYFSNSELASSGLPSKEELALLEPYRERIPKEVFSHEYMPPGTNGDGNLRANLKRAFALLAQAGWIVREGLLVNKKTGEPFEFELLIDDPTWERIALPYTRNLKRLGINARVRTVDTAQYQKRIEAFDFDMTVTVFGQSLSPGTEQRNYWSSATADQRGSFNFIGLKDPAIDELVEKLIASPDRKSLITRAHALDRVLLWGHYVVPHWHIRTFRVAYWDKFGQPEIHPKYALGFLDGWWIDPHKEQMLKERKTQTLSANEGPENGDSGIGPLAYTALAAAAGGFVLWYTRKWIRLPKG